jgi:hypothetical protein
LPTGTYQNLLLLYPAKFYCSSFKDLSSENISLKFDGSCRAAMSSFATHRSGFDLATFAIPRNALSVLSRMAFQYQLLNFYLM